MKTAITSTGNNAEARLDKRFGRCSYFVIYDTQSKSLEYIPNPYSNAEESAGSESVKLLAAKNVNRIISGEFGLKIKPLLDSLKIQMIVLKDSEKKISEIIELMNRQF
jgi:predicted Fe-Mo cluster-binding NifX family protein